MKINYLLTWLLMVFSYSVLAINSKELTDKTIAQAMSPSPRLVITAVDGNEECTSIPLCRDPVCVKLRGDFFRNF